MTDSDYSSEDYPSGARTPGMTSIYGIVRYINCNNFKIGIECYNKKIIYCEISRDLIGKLITKLNYRVGFNGIAEWDEETSSLKAFKILEIMRYEEGPFVEKPIKVAALR